MTESMVEKVARAIYETLAGPEAEPWEEMVDFNIAARAAMKAMRNPTKAMLNVGNKNIQGQANDPEWPSDPPFASAIWLAMIDQALETEDEF